MLRIAIIPILFSCALGLTKDISGAINVEQRILDNMLAHNYDNRIRPENLTDRVALVRTNIYLRAIEYVCSDELEWKAQITLRHLWNDQRLKFDDQRGRIKHLKLEDPNLIWKPDTFVANSVKTERHEDVAPNRMIRIYGNGNVLMSIRLTLTMTCPMNMSFYPFDSQICFIKLASYGFTTDDLVYMWRIENPIQVNKNLINKGFFLDKTSTETCSSSTSTGEYSCIKALFHLRRDTYKYKRQWFVPTAAITFVSFVSFWLKPNSCARIGLLVGTFSVLYLHIVFINKESSPTSHSTSKDWWLATCAYFMVAALLEYAVVAVIDNRSKNKEDDEGSGKDGQSEQTDLKSIIGGMMAKRNFVPMKEWSVGRRIDLGCALLFPIAFAAFIAIFATYHALKV